MKIELWRETVMKINYRRINEGGVGWELMEIM